MFSGIVEATGTVAKILKEGTNIHFTITSDISKEAYIDQSIAHNGVCLTVVEHDATTYVVTAIQETLDKTNLGNWQIGDIINLERSLTANARIDGHFVQGHVDTIATCKDILEVDGSWYFHFNIASEFGKYIVDKGSICINGVSLTVVTASDDSFSVAIIPYTYAHTNFSQLKIGSIVNIEFDILGKYIIKYLEKVKSS